MAIIKILKETANEYIFVLLDKNGNRYNLVDAVSATFIITNITPKNEDLIVLEKPMFFVDRNTGVVKVKIDNNDTNLDPESYLYSIIVSFGADDDRLLEEGLFVVYSDDIDTRLEQIKKKYGLNFSQYVLEEALRIGQAAVLNNAHEFVQNDTKGSPKTEILIDSTVADWNHDGVVDEADFNVYQYLPTSPYTVENLNSQIDSVDLDNPRQARLILKAPFPDNGYILRVEYYNARRPYDKSTNTLDVLEEKYMLLHLFENLEPYKLQHGMSSKDINGLKIDFDQNAISTYRASLKTQIASRRLRVVPFSKSKYNNAGKGGIMKSVQLSKMYDSEDSSAKRNQHNNYSNTFA